MPLSLTEALRLVALIRSLTVSGLRLLEENPRLRRGDIRRHWIAVENKWLATRYGLDAMYIRTPRGKRRPLKHDLAELIDRLLPVARDLGDEKYLAELRPLEKIETGAERQRRHYRENGNWKALAEYLVGQLAQDLEE
jgi:carboxylate-amine ligase